MEKQPLLAMRMGHQRVPEVSSSMQSIICPQGFCSGCWQERLLYYASLHPELT